MNSSITFQLNWNMTGKTVNGRQYSAPALAKQMREMVKNKELVITKKVVGEKGIKKTDIFASVASVKYNKGRPLFETMPLSPARRKQTLYPKDTIVEHPYVSVQGIGVEDNGKVRNFKLLNLFLTEGGV